MTPEQPGDSRRLAAIMFTDIVGFTALAQANEARAMRLLEAHNGLLRPFFARFRGRVVKTMGDSFLVEFESALAATNCAVEIQRSLRGAVGKSLGEEPFSLRIGVHLGDVITSNGDVLGDAVNIASRIRPLAEPGGVCVSGQVFDQVQNKVDVRFEQLTSPELKNVRTSTPVYRVVFPLESEAMAVSAPGPDLPRRMAVLPFTNMSPDPQDDFFADGLTEEIITELSRIPNLRVIARTSVMRYKTAPKSVREVGAELRVSNVLEGSVRKAGSRMRITAQLIDAASEEHLWAERFDRELADIFAVQADIAGSVAGALDLRLHTARAPSRSAPLNVEAYTLYLRGRYLWNQRTSPAVREALRRFEEAIALDPSFPLAHSGAADCYSVLVDRGALLRREAIPKARAAAERGIQLDPQLAEAHASLGLVLGHAGDVPGSERELRAAITLNPGYAVAHHWLSLLLEGSGRMDEARYEVGKAEESDPLSPAVLTGAGYVAWVDGHTDEALRKWERAIELSPLSDTANADRITLLVQTGRAKEASQLLKAFESGPADIRSKAWVGALGYAALGDHAAMMERIGRMRGLPNAGAIPPDWFGLIFAVAGDLDRAFEVLLKAPLETGMSTRAKLRTGPFCAKLRSDPRFEKLVQQWDARP